MIWGMQIGTMDAGNDLYYLMIALFFHKACASMALGISIKKANLSFRFSASLIAGYVMR